MVLNPQKLERLEKEEELRIESGMYAVPKYELDETMKEIKELAMKIRDRKAVMKQLSSTNKNSTKPVTPRSFPARVRERSVGKLRDEFENLGVDMSGTEDVSVSS